MDFDARLERELRRALDPIIRRPTPAWRGVAKRIQFGGGGEVVTSGVLAPVAAMAPEVPTSQF
jgi:hypothetical protein